MKRMYRGMSEVPAQKIEKMFGIKPAEGWLDLGNEKVKPAAHKWTYNSEIGAVFSATDKTGGLQDRPAGGVWDILIVGESDQKPTSPDTQIVDWAQVQKGSMTMIGVAFVKSDGSFAEKKAKLQSLIPGFQASPSMKDVFKRKSSKG